MCLKTLVDPYSESKKKFGSGSGSGINHSGSATLVLSLEATPFPVAPPHFQVYLYNFLVFSNLSVSHRLVRMYRKTIQKSLLFRDMSVKPGGEREGLVVYVRK